MAKRRPNHRLVKIHRNYTVEEIASLLGVHKNTVRGWIKVGLPTSDHRRPTLVLGHQLAAFLQARRAKGKQPCQPEEIYCVRCRTPRFPQEGWAEYQPVTEKFGNLTAICPNCDSIMNRRISMANLEQVRSKLDIAFPQALRQVNESNEPTVNSDLR
jgi:hypothetical protein